MGQCYGTYLITKGYDNDLLIKLTNKYFDKIRKEVVTKLVYTRTDINSVFEDLFPDYEIEETPKETVVSSGFDATYGWHDVMINWFEFCSPAFSYGDYLEIEGDEDKTTSIICREGATTTWSEINYEEDE